MGYTILSGLHDMPREIQVEHLENCLADDALKTLEDSISDRGRRKGSPGNDYGI